MSSSIDDAPLLSAPTWETLSQSHADFHAETSPYYDDVIHEIHDRIKSRSSIGKSDIGALLFWKRLRADTRWVRELMNMPDDNVRDHTQKAVAAVNDEVLAVPEAAAAGRSELSYLPGFNSGDALASALLFAAAPHRMAVYDRRAQEGLEKLGLSLSSAPGRYGRYMELVESIRSSASFYGSSWSARDVDVALFWLGGRTN
ncbi:hypothetical protein [Brevibacterium sediminis]|uniref:hypothetical protein n=1 Tax=Brevibacterium sediminis TaxID=1857024 RepID=UPI002006FA8D|nr:hypothetical protein [Brevibacterium sediminis]